MQAALPPEPLRGPARVDRARWGANGGSGGGRPGGAPDFQQVIGRLPAVTISDLQKDEAVMIDSTPGTGGAEVAAITLLSGVEPIITASPSNAAALLNGWNFCPRRRRRRAVVQKISGEVNDFLAESGACARPFYCVFNDRGSGAGHGFCPTSSPEPTSTQPNSAQAPSAPGKPGRLHGEVIDPTGAVIPGAAITLKNDAGQTFSAKSDGIGSYTVKDLPAGKYNISVSEKGFAPYLQEVQVIAGADQKMNITLLVQIKQENVDVGSDAARVNVSPDSNASFVVISGKDLEALSDDPDELQSELQALAGPSAGPNGGQIYIDGFTGGQLPPSRLSARSESTRIRFPRNTIAWASAA